MGCAQGHLLALLTPILREALTTSREMRTAEREAGLLLKEETGHLGCELVEKTRLEAGGRDREGRRSGPRCRRRWACRAVVRFPRKAHSTSTQTEPDALADPFRGGGMEAGQWA